jgi:two-component sensor histidine kinase/PAS domain-containing protein
MPPAAEGVAPTERTTRLPVGRRPRPVAVHLGLFAAGILVPVLAIVALMLIDTARRWRDDSLQDARIIAHHLNATIDVELEKAIAIGQTLAAALALDGDVATFDAQARDVAKRLGFNVTLRDLSGQQLSNSFVPPGAALPVGNASIREVDRLAAERKAVVISDLRIATVRKLPAVNAVIPVIKDSKVAYLASASISPARFSEILGAGLPAGWIAGLIGRDGRLIARSAENDRYAGTANPAFFEQVTLPEGIWSGTSREGVPVAGAYIRSALSGWTVSVAVPQEILRAPAESAMLSLVGLVAASLVVSTFFGWRLSRRISAPLRDLAFRARELGHGRMPAVTPSRLGEVNDVTEALRAASVELDRRALATNHATEAVRANEERLQLVQDTAGIGTVDWDIPSDRAISSPRFNQMFALSPEGPARFADLVERVNRADRDRIERARDQLFGQGGPFEQEFRIVTPDGENRWIYVKGRLDLRNGQPHRLLGASIDITDRKRSEEHLMFLLREISHRSKNLLAVIQAMAGQTAKTAESVEVFRRRFGERLMGIAASHDLLVNQNWLGASVESLVRGQLEPFIEPNDPRVQLRGPVVDLKSESTEALGLALHELATNSLKYGALSDQAGKVEIVWDVYESAGDRTAAAGGRRFRMDWIEHAVEPVSPPSHKGFGRMVIEHTVEATLGGTVTLDFPPGGVRWRIDAPATCLAPPARVVAA